MSDRRADPWRPLRVLAYGVAAVSLVCLVVGSIATDHFLWSQWIWWVPRPVLAVMSLPALVSLLVRRGQCRWLRAVGLLGASLPIVVTLASDVRWRAWDPAIRGVRVVHWNASWPGSAAGEGASSALLALDADVVVISNPYKLLGDGRDELWQAAGYDVVRSERFLLASRWPILEFRAGSDEEDRVLAVARCDVDGRAFRIAMVDLPSDARLSRAAIAAAFRAEADLPSADEAELVVGDFNITRGSASLSAMFPGFRHAFDEAGTGFGATWPRRLPMHQLDQMLLGTRVRCQQYRVIDLGSRVHRGQEAILRVE